jgi:hypothetical protein
MSHHQGLFSLIKGALQMLHLLMTPFDYALFWA